MSTVVGFEECPRCKNETLWVDYDCHTGEHDYYCQKCGCGHHYRFKWNGNGHLVTNRISYLRENLVFAVKDFETDEVLWEKNLADIKNLSTKMVAEFINYQLIEFGELPKGHQNIFDKTNNYSQLYYIGDSFDIEDDKTLIHVKPDAEEEAYVGYGLIVIETLDGNTKCFEVIKEMSKEDAQQKFKDIVSEVGKNNIKEVLVATWFNEESEQLEELSL